MTRLLHVSLYSGYHQYIV